MKYLIVTYFRGNLISRKLNGHISRDLNVRLKELNFAKIVKILVYMNKQ